MIRPPLSLLQAEQSQHSQPFLIKEMFQTSSSWHLAGPSPLTPGLPWTGEPRTGHRCGLTRADPPGKITTLDLLGTFFLMHPRVLMAFLAPRTHCWLMDSLLGPRNPRSFYWCPLWLLPWCRTLHLPLLSLDEPPLCPVQIPLTGSTPQWSISHSPQFYIISRSAEGTVFPFSQVINE